MANVYTYEALPSGSHIRYLLLQPGGSEDPIVCSLHVTEIENPAPYEAISYVWGIPERTVRIECDGRSLYITVNLWNSLLQVRRLDKPRALWSDYICINQADNEEKAQQVSLMADIYRKSTRTLICLGSNDGREQAEAAAAAGMIATVNYMMDKVFQDKNFSWEPNSFPCPLADDPLLSDPRWESVATLIGQAWFRRGWVVQEAALGPMAEIIWDGVHIDWLYFLRSYSWIITKALIIHWTKLKTNTVPWLHLGSFQMRLTRESRALEAVDLAQSLTLLQVLDHFRGLGVTDPRDRIYACMSLPHSTIYQGPQLTALKPDYNKGHVQVYHDFACAYLEASGMDIDLLGYTQNFGHTNPAAECPSWVPLWDVKDYYYASYRCNTRRHSSQFPGRTPSLPSLIDRNTLKVRGVPIGSVQHATKVFSERMVLETVGKIWREVEGLGTNSHLGNNIYHQSAKIAFVRTLSAANYIGDHVEWERRQAEYMDYIQRKTSPQLGLMEIETSPSIRAEEDQEDMWASVAEVHNITMSIAHNRKLVVTDRGYYGLAPFTVEKGDVIYIVIGTTSPFILRPAGLASPGVGQKYKLVGDVFMFSAKGAESGDELLQLGGKEGYDDWKDWDLQEKDILIC